MATPELTSKTSKIRLKFGTQGRICNSGNLGILFKTNTPYYETR